MDAGALLARAESIAPAKGKVLEKARFGRSGTACLWVEMQAVESLAQALKSDSETSLDFLENLSVIQMEDALVISYFLHSRLHGHSLVMRGSLVPRGPGAPVEAPSVGAVWPEALLMERENEELFGVFFGRAREASEESPWPGYPLRKSQAR